MARASAVKMPPEANAAHGCEGARRVLALMLTFSADDHTLTARQLAERTGIALPSVYRYLTLLRETGLLAGDERGSYRLSARLVGLARAAEAAESIIDVADPVMPPSTATPPPFPPASANPRLPRPSLPRSHHASHLPHRLLLLQARNHDDVTLWWS